MGGLERKRKGDHKAVGWRRRGKWGVWLEKEKETKERVAGRHRREKRVDGVVAVGSIEWDGGWLELQKRGRLVGERVREREKSGAEGKGENGRGRVVCVCVCWGGWPEKGK